MIELRYSLGRALRAERKRRRMTQRQLALIMGADQATISRVERASAGVSLDQVIWAFLALDLTDEKIAEAINAGLYHGVKWPRRRMALKFEQRPARGFRRARARRRKQGCPDAPGAAARKRKPATPGRGAGGRRRGEAALQFAPALPLW